MRRGKTASAARPYVLGAALNGKKTHRRRAIGRPVAFTASCSRRAQALEPNPNLLRTAAGRCRHGRRIPHRVLNPRPSTIAASRHSRGSGRSCRRTRREKWRSTEDNQMQRRITTSARGFRTAPRHGAELAMSGASTNRERRSTLGTEARSKFRSHHSMGSLAVQFGEDKEETRSSHAIHHRYGRAAAWPTGRGDPAKRPHPAATSRRWRSSSMAGS